MNGVAEFPSPSIGVQIKCVEREISKRRYVYPRLVAAGKLKKQKADYEIAAMEAVLKTLQEIQEPPPMGVETG